MRSEKSHVIPLSTKAKARQDDSHPLNFTFSHGSLWDWNRVREAVFVELPETD